MIILKNYFHQKFDIESNHQNQNLYQFYIQMHISRQQIMSAVQKWFK